MSTEIISKIQMYDPKREYIKYKPLFDNAISSVLQHGLFINGPEIIELERSLEKFTNSKHCITVSNGTDALLIALLALDIGRNDEVITVAHTWISTAEVISLINAIPVFVDIDEETFNINPDKIIEKINNNTKAIIVVSLYGQMPDFKKINEISKKFNIPIIEDGAQSFGAEYFGKKSCNVTKIGTTSFFPSKPLGCFGDGGACFTNDDVLASKIRAIKNHGGVKRFNHKYIGINARLDTIQASILNVKLTYFKETILLRNNCANYYSDKLKNLETKGLLKLPTVANNHLSVWAQYSILAQSESIRNNIVDFLKKNNVNVSIFYPIPLYKQECFSYLNYKNGSLPITEKVCSTVFNLPCYAYITLMEQDYIINLLNKFFKF